LPGTAWDSPPDLSRDVTIEFGMFAKEQDGKRPAEKSPFLAKYPVEDGDCTISVTVFRGRASALRPVRCGDIVTGT
ncbi:MAG: hypothetical protein ACP5PN_04540, partial [Steroidobacteraceae bacterium]